MASRGWDNAVATDLALKRAVVGPRMPYRGATMPHSARPRTTQASGRVDLADALLSQIVALRLPVPMREFRPFNDRKFRVDLAYVADLIAIEVDGAEWSQGRHSRGAGMASDNDKLNRLTLEGWACFRFTGGQVRNGAAIRLIEQLWTS